MFQKTLTFFSVLGVGLVVEMMERRGSECERKRKRKRGMERVAVRDTL